MQKIIKVVVFATVCIFLSIKSSLAILDLDFKASYSFSTNTDSSYKQNENGLLLGAEIGLANYVPIPILSAMSVGLDYHNVNFIASKQSSVVKTNLVSLSLSYDPLKIIPFVSPYVSAGVAVDFGDRLFSGMVFEESVVEQLTGKNYETNLFNLMFAAGIELDGFTMVVPVIPYVEYRTYIIGVDIMNAAREKIGKESSVVQSIILGMQYRF